MKNQTLVKNSKVAFLLLPSRLLLFLLFQLGIAAILNSFEESVKYWILIATLTNISSILFLYILLKKEQIRFFTIFSFSKLHWKKDLLIFLVLTLLCGPLVFIPNMLLSNYFWGDMAIPTTMLFQTIPMGLITILLILFPITIALAELYTYFGYIMPRIANSLKRKWIAILLPVIFLSIQHCTLPLILDPKFILYRAFMFSPFALLIGISIYKRPRLFPYFAIMHGIMDFFTVVMYFQIK